MKTTFFVVAILVVCFCIGVFPLWNHIFALSYFETDFIDYCVTLESYSLEHDPGFRRSRFGMIVVYLLSFLTDVLGAFTWNALLCTFLLLVVFYRWILSIEEHKIQAAIAMEQRAKAAGKTSAAQVYRRYINANKKSTRKS